MTPERALEIIKDELTVESGIINEALKIIENAVEKQIPKKAEHEDGVWSICPNCGGSVCNDTEHAVNKEVSYCEHCGQAIDWSENNE